MVSTCLSRVLLCFIFLIGPLAVGMQPDAPINAQQFLLVIKHDGSQGVARINGVPAHHFSSSLGQGSETDSVGSMSMFAKNGANVITVEARPEAAGHKASTEVSVIVNTGSFDDLNKSLFTQKIDGSGSATYTVVLQGVPQWAFLTGTAWSGDKNAVLAAVRALHKAYADRDFKTIEAVQKAGFDDLSAAMGEALGSYADLCADQRKLLKTAKLSPLDAQLTVESFYDGRLLVVSDKDGLAPIRLASAAVDKEGRPKETMATGQFWIYRDGKWSVIRTS